MGAPKQKWTAEEEAALKAGVLKHGSGKWQTILRDPEFSQVLRSRSNVDLKDKWRNINVTLSGLGSREKARLALKKKPQVPKIDDQPVAVKNAKVDDKVAETNAVLAPSETVQVADSKKTYTRMDKLILEAITTLNEPKGSDKNSIAMFIEDQYWAPANFRKKLASKMKLMIANGQLEKVKHRYRISSGLTPSEPLKKSASDNNNNNKHEAFPRTTEQNGVKMFTRPQVIADLENMRRMSAHEAAAAAARAVAEAEAAIAEAEKAAREADAAEAEAEAAHVFAEAAMKALNCQNLCAC